MGNVEQKTKHSETKRMNSIKQKGLLGGNPVYKPLRN